MFVVLKILFSQKGQCSIFTMFYKSFSVIILDVHNFRVFEIFRQFTPYFTEISNKRGRFKKLDVKDRLCKVCSTGAVEEEPHLMFNCSAYHTQQYRFLMKVQKSCKNFSNL